MRRETEKQKKKKFYILKKEKEYVWETEGVFVCGRKRERERNGVEHACLFNRFPNRQTDRQTELFRQQDKQVYK